MRSGCAFWIALLLVCLLSVAASAQQSLCTTDAMIVFDASGSMFDSATKGVRRIDEARLALSRVLPSATHFRRVGLITYGPGPYDQCNVKLNFEPMPNAAGPILSAVKALEPAGRTPLASAVEEAANVLDYKNQSAVIVVVTDGEETCEGSPCAIAKELHAAAKDLTIHVIGYRLEEGWTGQQSRLESKCLAHQNNGVFITAKTEAELVASLERTLGCPLVSQNVIAKH
jgi:Ca-activated chloride channel family protein